LPYIPLDRRFFEWREKEHDELTDPDVLGRFGLSDHSKGWDDLLKRRRVVILAEAGSGKSDEMEEQARRLTAEGKLAFYATVQDVGRQGLEPAFKATDRPRFTAWRNNDQAAIFLLDSIDEAKLDNIRLERALQNIADAIVGAEGRAHIILSGRHTDWQFRRDRQRLTDILPIPPPQPPLPPPSPEQLLIQILHHERPPEVAEAEEALVVVMASLDPKRVRLFAVGKHATNV
jgi:hypothetical protein